MLFEWDALSEKYQLALARDALREALQTLACQAKHLAEEFELGTIVDRGGPDALRLFAALLLIGADFK